MKTNQSFSRYDQGFSSINFNLKQTSQPSRLTQIGVALTVRNYRIRAYTKLRVEPQYWDKSVNRCICNDLLCLRVRKRMQFINSRLNEIQQQIEQTDMLLAEKGRYIAIDDVRKVIVGVVSTGKGKKEDTITVMKRIASDYHEHINRRGEMGRANTSRTYVMAVSRLENYLDSRNRKATMTFDDFNKSFFDGFSDYLSRYSYSRATGSKKYTALTVASTLGAIRNILHRAYDMGLSDNTSYISIGGGIPHSSSDKIYLTERELSRLAGVKVRSESEANVRDMFLVASFTALRISDINRLNESAFSSGMITLSQTKTKSIVHIPILKEISPLIEKYREISFPYLNTSYANICIKELASRAGIDETILVSEIRGGVRQFKQVPKYSQISFHTARRSCITNLFKKGYSPNYLMTLSGHKSISSFERYIKSSAEEMSHEFILELKKKKAI